MSGIEEDKHVDEKKIPKSNISIENPQWIGDALTGYRSFEVLSEIGKDNQKVIRRYSNFVAFRNKLVTQYPFCIIPI